MNSTVETQSEMDDDYIYFWGEAAKAFEPKCGDDEYFDSLENCWRECDNFSRGLHFFPWCRYRRKKVNARSVPNANENQPVATVNKSSSESDLTKLRIRVAELFGWRQSTYEKEGRPGIGDYEVWVSPSGHMFDRYVEQGAEKENTYLPDYPSDLNACKTLIDLLAEKGWTCQLDNGLDKTWECTFETGTSGHKDFKQHYEAADELAVAICRAFVAVMEGRSVQGGNEK
jgi:hypothetical protein